MAQEQQALSEADKAFMQKLGAFRRTLSTEDKQRLDGLVLAAHGVEQRAAVTGYQEAAGQRGPWSIDWFHGNDPDNPQWYAYGGGTSGGAGAPIPVPTVAPAWTAGYRPS